MKKQFIFTYIAIVAAGMLLLTSCVKVDYTKIDEPAYLRVFNNLNYAVTMDNKDAKLPFLCMIINPTFDGGGKVNGGEIIGDFFDKREPYAPPYPSHIGSSNSVNNPEYPGKNNVLVGPILNGYDLSSWAQVPSGTMRVMFLYRPKNTTPYFQLDANLIGDVMLDTTLNLSAHEVYTMHILQENFAVRNSKILLREETFQKQPLSDSLNYVNFYNYSAEGFVEADDNLKPRSNRADNFQDGIQNRMDVYLSIFPNQNDAESDYVWASKGLQGYRGKFLTSVVRNNKSTAAAPYISFPVWANPADNGISTQNWQVFDFLTPGITPATNNYGRNQTDTDGNWGALYCLFNGSIRPANSNGFSLPNLNINIHSGKNNPQSFASVNTIEVVNGSVYLTTIQRKYPAPEY